MVSGTDGQSVSQQLISADVHQRQGVCFYIAFILTHSRFNTDCVCYLLAPSVINKDLRLKDIVTLNLNVCTLYLLCVLLAKC